jgi:hypothetical protein
LEDDTLLPLFNIIVINVTETMIDDRRNEGQTNDELFTKAILHYEG